MAVVVLLLLQLLLLVCGNDGDNGDDDGGADRVCTLLTWWGRMAVAAKTPKATRSLAQSRVFVGNPSSRNSRDVSSNEIFSKSHSLDCGRLAKRGSRFSRSMVAT